MSHKKRTFYRELVKKKIALINLQTELLNQEAELIEVRHVEKYDL